MSMKSRLCVQEQYLYLYSRVTTENSRTAVCILQCQLWSRLTHRTRTISTLICYHFRLTPCSVYGGRDPTFHRVFSGITTSYRLLTTLNKILLLLSDTFKRHMFKSLPSYLSMALIYSVLPLVMADSIFTCSHTCSVHTLLHPVFPCPVVYPRHF